jgi:hypothetical protein
MKMRHLWILSGLAALSGAALATVPASGPTSAPAATATAPAIPADYSTPAAAVKSYLRALAANDPAGIHDALVAPEARKEELEALLSLTIAQGRLQREAKERFKSDGEKVFAGDPRSKPSLAAQLKAVDEAVVEATADAATVAMPAEAGKAGEQIALKKIGSAWKLDAVALYSLDAEKTAARVALARTLTTVTETTLKEMVTGKFVTASEAYQEYWLRMAAASKGATSAPATSSMPATAH